MKMNTVSQSKIRGALLGALLGAAHGTEKFPERWVGGLVEPLPDFIKAF